MASAALGLVGSLAAAAVFLPRKPKPVPLVPYTAAEWKHACENMESMEAKWPLILQQIAEMVGLPMGLPITAWHPLQN